MKTILSPSVIIIVLKSVLLVVGYEQEQLEELPHRNIHNSDLKIFMDMLNKMVHKQNNTHTSMPFCQNTHLAVFN